MPYAVSLLKVLVLVCTVAIAGCRDQNGSDYVLLSGKIFVFNYRIAEARFVVTLAKLKPMLEGTRVVGRFDNPAGGERIVIDQKVWANSEKIVLESAALRCVVKDRPYPFEVEIIGPDGAVLQKISNEVVSSLDQDILPDRPLVVGPAYEPNPELQGRADGKIDWPEKLPCPAK